MGNINPRVNKQHLLMPCSYTKCLNHIDHKVEEVQSHLFRNRIDLSYTNWTKHGENDEPSISVLKPVNSTTEFVDDTYFASDIPTDGPATVEMVNATKDNFDEDDLVKFQELLLDAKKPLYKGFLTSQSKNVVESLVETLLHVSGKTKDEVNARLDLDELGVKPELFAMQEEDKTTLPPTSYTLTNAKKTPFVKRHTTPGKEMILQELDKMQAELVMTLCQLEKFIPLAFYDIMIHLTVQLTIEVERELAISKESVSKTVRWISYGPRATVVTCDAYNINGVNHRAGAVKRDTLGYILVDLNNLGNKVDPFILASQARQVFYVKDQIDKKLSIVFKTPPKNYKGTYDEDDEEFSTVIHQRNDNMWIPIEWIFVTC
nr:hypothetical protein [Tanacetum cinerariifolium]